MFVLGGPPDSSLIVQANPVKKPAQKDITKLAKKKDNDPDG